MYICTVEANGKAAPNNGAASLWNEDKMKKMKLSLASIILPGICYTKNQPNVTQMLSATKIGRGVRNKPRPWF